MNDSGDSVKGNTHTTIVQLLLDVYPDRFNINQIARKVSLSVGGVFKSLTRLEEMNILSSEVDGNAKMYQLDLSSAKGRKFSELVLFRRNKKTLSELSEVTERAFSLPEDVLMIFFKKNKPKLLFVCPSEKSKKKVKSIKSTHKREFVTFAKFKSNLKNERKFKDFWDSYTPIYGESLFFRLLGEFFHES